MPEPRAADTPRRRWARATGIRLGLLGTAAAAGFGVSRLVDSAWVAWAVALFVLVNLWSIYLFARYRTGPTPSANADASHGAAAADGDEQATRRAAYQKVVHDLFPLASRPQRFSRPLKGVEDAWRRGGDQRPDDEND